MGKMSFNVAGLGSGLRRWTASAKECYLRNFICEGCEIVPERFHGICQIKTYALASYRKFGKPDNNITEEESDD